MHLLPPSLPLLAPSLPPQPQTQPQPNHSGNGDGGAVAVCLSVPCCQRQALIWTDKVEGNNGLRLGKFNLFEGIEPADQDHEFCIRHSLSAGYRNAILFEFCKVAECARDDPLVWWKWVDVSSRAVEMEVKEGEEPADAIFQALQPLGVPLPDWRKVMDETKSNGVPRTREYGLEFFTGTVRTEDSCSNPIYGYMTTGRSPLACSTSLCC